MENQRIVGLCKICPIAAFEESNPFIASNCFPNELIREILLKLPVKSLLKFRCVSKSWLSLISSSQFAKAHAKISAHDKSSRNYRIVARYYSEWSLERGVIDFPLKSLLNELTIDPIDLDDPTTRSRFSDSCHGLILINTRRNLILWNPSLRKIKNLRGPKLTHDVSLENCTSRISYDDSSDDYKIVVFVEKYGRVGFYDVRYDYKVVVYSLKIKSWKKIGDFNDLKMYSCPVNVNGKLHWLEGVVDDGASEGFNIVYLDLATEIFGMLKQPPGEVGELFKRSYCGHKVGSPELLVLSRQLCVYYASSINLGHVWVMKEYGATESWTELMTISFDTIGGLCLKLKPIHLFENGEILLYSGSHLLAIHNSKNKTFRFPLINNFLYTCSSQMYVESLVSPI